MYAKVDADFKFFLTFTHFLALLLLTTGNLGSFGFDTNRHLLSFTRFITKQMTTLSLECLLLLLVSGSSSSHTCTKSIGIFSPKKINYNCFPTNHSLLLFFLFVLVVTSIFVRKLVRTRTVFVEQLLRKKESQVLRTIQVL
jgi:hypothetical protein